MVECFELFFDKEIIQYIVREINRHEEQYKNAKDNLFPLCSFVRLWIPVIKIKIFIVREFKIPPSMDNV
jgi:hypothetical protein